MALGKEQQQFLTRKVAKLFDNVGNQPALPTLRFSSEFGLVFCGVAGFFDELRVACF